MTDPPFLSPGGIRRRRPPQRRSRFGRLAYITLGVVVAAFAAGKALKVLHSGGKPQALVTAEGNRESEEETIPEHPSGAQPPLRLSPAGPHHALSVSFHHPPRAGLVFNLDTGEVLWAREPTRVLPVASLVKMMTALLVVAAEPPDATVPITRKAVDAAGSKVGLLPRGRRVPVQALLYGLLLPSGNDAAIALAEAVSGSVRAFVDRMNAQAARMGLTCTHFASPDGLDNANSSCAVDLAELADADLAQPRLAPIVGSPSAVVRFPIKGGKLYLYNNNPLLRYGYSGATGVKTGETDAAGLCLVGTAERHGVRLGVVLLHSPELGRQAAFLLDRAFQRVYHQRPVPEPLIPRGR